MASASRPSVWTSKIYNVAGPSVCVQARQGECNSARRGPQIPIIYNLISLNCEMGRMDFSRL